MNHIIFKDNTQFSTAVLIKNNALRKSEMEKHYIGPLLQKGMKEEDIIGLDLAFNDAGKAPVKLIRSHLDNLLPALNKLGTKTILVCDGSYFKTLTKQRKSEPHLGYVMPCAIEGHEHINIVLGVNYQSLFYKPENQAKLDMSLDTLVASTNGLYRPPGQGIIHSAQYPETFEEIDKFINNLHQYPELTCDIEAFSLQFWKAGIGTIAFAWDEHNGGAFAVDYIPVLNSTTHQGQRLFNKKVRDLLVKFFNTYQGKIIYHGIGYDGKVLVYQLFMAHALDTEGMLNGIEVMTKNFDDSMLITYLATNSTSGNDLKLKNIAHDFAGNYAKEDIDDIRLIKLPELLEYNLVDCLSTWYVCNKNKPVMVLDKQEDIYNSLIKPSVATIMQMELTGVPMVPENIATARNTLETIQKKHLNTLENHQIIIDFTKYLKLQRVITDNEKLKTKKRKIEELDHIKFNPNSTTQLQELLYNQMSYPVIDKTDTKLPATGAGTIKKLNVMAKDPEHKKIFEALIGFSEVTTILNTFISSFEENSFQKADGRWYLHGNYRIGGTVSGRLSSAGPNMQNLPSTGSIYAKHTKQCFVAPDGWLLVGVDFNSLEDYISALTTKDPNKLKVYIDGYDGHCYRAYSYWPEEFPGIVDTPNSINSIKKNFPELRQKSKAPTFLLTYGGTYHGLMANVGFTEEEAKKIEERYHSLYKVSDDWVADRIKEASKKGYVEVAFGLRVRTPILKKVILDSRTVPYEAKKEARTAGNALGQSYGLLNNRASNEFRERTLKSPYRLDVLPIMQVHDSQYLLVRDDVDVVDWVNRNIIECMEWQELPEIKHDIVKIGAEMDIHWPDWSQAVTIPNKASKETIRELTSKHIKNIEET